VNPFPYEEAMSHAVAQRDAAVEAPDAARPDWSRYGMAAAPTTRGDDMSDDPKRRPHLGGRPLADLDLPAPVDPPPSPLADHTTCPVCAARQAVPTDGRATQRIIAHVEEALTPDAWIYGPNLLAWLRAPEGETKP
jgi:hypothetical protein